LRNTGSESLDSLINMLHSYQQKQMQVREEIKKLKQLIFLKDDEITGLDEDIS
jgi:peptidoglycan hydrolase CwlO-like protein